MSDLMAVARRVLALVAAGEKGDKGDKPPTPDPFSPLSPLFHPTGEPWNGPEALRLMAECDDLVERLEVDGTDRDIYFAAAVVSSAYSTGDMETVRYACCEFTALVREKRGLREKSHSFRRGA